MRIRCLYPTLIAFFAVNSCADRPGAEDGATSGAQPAAADNNVFVAAYQPPHPVPDTISVGSFEIANGCLVFRDTARRMFLPVLPEGTKVEGQGTDARVVTPMGETLATVGEQVRIRGGEGHYGPAEPSARSSCPKQQILLEGKRG